MLRSFYGKQRETLQEGFAVRGPGGANGAFPVSTTAGASHGTSGEQGSAAHPFHEIQEGQICDTFCQFITTLGSAMAG